MVDDSTLGEAAPDRLLGCTERSAGSSEEDAVRIFVIFDTEHDSDLYALLHAQSDSPDCGFSVMGGSEGANHTEVGRARVRSQIREADQAIVICGEHTEDSPSIHTEFLIAADEETPYFLLWGRRSVMCTKPIGATAAEGMYTWTGQMLHDQIAFNLRQPSRDAEDQGPRGSARDGPTFPSAATTQDEDTTTPTTMRAIQ